MRQPGTEGTERTASKYKVATVARPLGFAREKRGTGRWSGKVAVNLVAILPRSGERSYVTLSLSRSSNLLTIKAVRCIKESLLQGTD